MFCILNNFLIFIFLHQWIHPALEKLFYTTSCVFSLCFHKLFVCTEGDSLSKAGTKAKYKHLRLLQLYKMLHFLPFLFNLSAFCHAKPTQRLTSFSQTFKMFLHYNSLNLITFYVSACSYLLYNMLHFWERPYVKSYQIQSITV